LFWIRHKSFVKKSQFEQRTARFFSSSETLLTIQVSGKKGPECELNTHSRPQIKSLEVCVFVCGGVSKQET